jgi:hypothetical protein
MISDFIKSEIMLQAGTIQLPWPLTPTLSPLTRGEGEVFRR